MVLVFGIKELFVVFLVEVVLIIDVAISSIGLIWSKLFLLAVIVDKEVV